MGFGNLPRTVSWLDGEVQLIDQTRLPAELRLVRLKNTVEVASAIKNMIVRGAPAIGVTAAMGLALAAYHSKVEEKNQLMMEIDDAVEVIGASRPTARNLFWALERVRGVADKTKGNVQDIVKAVVNEAIKIGEEDIQSNRKIGFHGAALLHNGDTVLTHCN